MMYIETDHNPSKLIFFFIDFGSSHKIGSSLEMIETCTPNFSPPEQNFESKSYDLNKQCEKTDIYSLSKSLSNILYSSKIKISPFIQQILDEMSFDEIEKRLSIDDCIERISNYSPQNLVIEKKDEEAKEQVLIENNILNDKNSNLDVEKFEICENFEDICSEMKIFCAENKHSSLPEIEELVYESEYKMDKKTLIQKIKVKEEKIMEQSEQLLLQQEQINKLMELLKSQNIDLSNN